MRCKNKCSKLFINFTHCKFRNEAIGVDELELLKKYAQVFGKGKRYHYYIFSKGGFTEGLKTAADRGEVNLISLDNMY